MSRAVGSKGVLTFCNHPRLRRQKMRSGLLTTRFRFGDRALVSIEDRKRHRESDSEKTVALLILIARADLKIGVLLGDFDSETRPSAIRIASRAFDKSTRAESTSGRAISPTASRCVNRLTRLDSRCSSARRRSRSRAATMWSRNARRTWLRIFHAVLARRNRAPTVR